MYKPTAAQKEDMKKICDELDQFLEKHGLSLAIDPDEYMVVYKPLWRSAMTKYCKDNKVESG